MYNEHLKEIKPYVLYTRPASTTFVGPVAEHQEIEFAVGIECNGGQSEVTVTAVSHREAYLKVSLMTN